ncbi:myosin-2 essential light chain-like [Amphiura filiformis]|uniref:myosin-2 essential light chain-like n=1 Tax=Amphiura filiformis TaxID=82378 RepID=UPI003B2271DB
MSISEDQKAEYLDAFLLFDRRGDNKIEVEQLGDVVRALGQNPTNAEVKKVSHGYPQGHRISFEEFLPILTSFQKAREFSNHEDYVEGLKVFDKDGNGTINSAELRHVLTSLGEKLLDDEVDQLLTGQEDSQGQVNYEELVKMVMST